MCNELIIDAHMHLYETADQGSLNKSRYQIWEYGEKPGVPFGEDSGTPDEGLASMRRAGVSYSIVVNLFATSEVNGHLTELLPGPAHRKHSDAIETSMAEPVGKRLMSYNRWLVTLARAHSELLPFVAVDPWALSPAQNAWHLRDLIQYGGVKGIKIHPVVQRFKADDERLWPVYEICSQEGLPVVAHSGPSQGSTQHAEPRAYTAVLANFPDLILVLAHLGGASWTQLRDFAFANPSVYFDCSEIICWTGAPMAPSANQLAELIRDIGPERVLLGSDYPWYNMDVCVGLLKRLPVLSDHDKSRILGRNAAILLRLTTPTDHEHNPAEG